MARCRWEKSVFRQSGLPQKRSLRKSSKAVGMSVKVKDIEAYKKELRNDYIITKELSNLSGRLALQCGRLLAVANMVLITSKHIDFDAYLEEQQSSKNAEATAEATAGAMLEQ